jgi:hypothetical protein
MNATAAIVIGTVVVGIALLATVVILMRRARK